MSDVRVVLEASCLTKRFAAPSMVEAVRNISLRLTTRELVALVGPSGAGKSTLLALLSGLQTPTAGHVTINGFDLATGDASSLPRVRNLEIGFVFQFHHLLPELTAIENVLLPAMISIREGWRKLEPMSVFEDRARDLLHSLGVGARAMHLPTQLSGGEAQRVALARALMNNPAIVMADEPTGNLDQRTSLELMDMMRALNEREGQTFLIATHNPELRRRSTRVLEMVNGELVS